MDFGEDFLRAKKGGKGVNYEAEINAMKQKIATLEVEVQELPDKVADLAIQKQAERLQGVMRGAGFADV